MQWLPIVKSLARRETGLTSHFLAAALQLNHFLKAYLPSYVPPFDIATSSVRFCRVTANGRLVVVVKESGRMLTLILSDQQSVVCNDASITRKRGKAQRVARPACANATVHFFT